MGGLVSGVFGGGKKKTTSEASIVPIKWETPKNFRVNLGGRRALGVNGITGDVSMDRSRLDPILHKTRKDLGGQRQRYLGMIRSLKGNQNAFIQARVRPMQQALQEQLAAQDRSMAQRGVFGSLANNEQTKARFLGEQAIGDERAKATDEALSKIFDAEAGLRGVTQDQAGIAELMLKDELSRLGLSLEALNMSLNSRKQLTTSAGGTVTESGGSDILGGIGKVVSIADGVKGLGGLTGLLSAFSDRRLKEDISPLGYEVAGLPVYSFRYVWGQDGVGFMADEVEKIYPEAVFEVSGYKAVDYGMIMEAARG